MTSVKCPASTQHQLAEKEYRILAKLYMDSTKTFTKTWEIKTLSFKKKDKSAMSCLQVPLSTLP